MTRKQTLFARLAVSLMMLTASWVVGADPVRSTATAHVGARIIAAPHVVATPQVPASLVVSQADRDRGYTLVSLTTSSTSLLLAAGDRDEERTAPAQKGVLTVRTAASAERIELVWHAE